MAFTIADLAGLSSGNGHTDHYYTTTADTLATCVAADYMLTAFRQLGAGDLIFISGSDVNGLYEVTASSSTTVTVAPALTDPASLVYIQGSIVDVSTADSRWLISPVAGTIETIWTVIDGTIATAPAVITLEIGGTLVTGSSVSIADSGSAAGDVDTASPTAANVITAGGAIEVITSGASTNTVVCDVLLAILPT